MKIAIVGMACRYPGANDHYELFQNILAGRRYFRQMPGERMGSEYFDDDPKRPDTTYCRLAAVLENFDFNPAQFMIPQSTFGATDMAQWLALQVSHEALLDADQQHLNRERTAVIFGNSLAGDGSRAQVMRYRWPYVGRIVDELLDALGVTGAARAEMRASLEERYKAPFAQVDEDSLAGGLSNTIPGRVCNHFDFKGGGYTVDGACSSSLLAVIQACHSLQAGDIDLALAGGVDLSLDPFELVGFAKVGALSGTDIKVYDQRSSGFLPGEGCGVIVLKRHDDALADNDRIYATIAGWGTSSDGRGGLTAPSIDGQMLAIARAYQRAGYGIGSIGLMEGHGTGTPVGDKVELSALARSFELDGALSASCGIGSVKSNVGHTKAAAGVAGLIKACMALYHRILPPTQALQVPNAVLAASAALYPLTRGARWDSTGARRAGVSSAGFGGINTHVTLEEASAGALTPASEALLPLLHTAQDSEVFFLGAAGVAGLLTQIATVADAAAKIAQAQLVDLASHCARLSAGSLLRLGIVADTPATLLARLEHAARIVRGDADAGVHTPQPHFSRADGIYFGRAGARPRVVFLFPGQGSQRVNAGALWRARFGFLDTHWRHVDQVLAGDEALAGVLPEPLSRAVFRDLQAASPGEAKAAAEHLAQTTLAQPAILAGALAGAELLRYFGIEADMCLGHSLGEYAALCHAGGIALDDAVRLVARRGQAMQCDGNGAMLSISAAPDRVQVLLHEAGDTLTIASFNAPEQTVVAGEAGAIDSLLSLCRARAIDATRLPVAHAFHSPFMDEATRTMRPLLEAAPLTPLKRLLVSSVSGELVHSHEQMRTLLLEQISAPVQYVRAVQAALDEDCEMFVEVGPGGVNSRLVRAIAGERAVQVFAIDSANPETPMLDLNHLLASGFASGMPIRTNRVFESRHVKPIALPYLPRFIASPCENVVAPLRADRWPTLREGAGGVPDAAADSAQVHVAEPAQNEEAIAGAIASPAEILSMLQQYCVRRYGYPAEVVQAEAYLQSDLGIDSLKSVELVADAMGKLGLVGDATRLVGLTLEGIAQRLADMQAQRQSAAGERVTPALAGLPSWVQSFETVLRPVALVPALPGPGPGLDGPVTIVDGGHPLLAAAVMRRLQLEGLDATVIAAPCLAGALDGCVNCVVVLPAASAAHQRVDAGVEAEADWTIPLLLLHSARQFLGQLSRQSRPAADRPTPVFAVINATSMWRGLAPRGASSIDARAAAGFAKSLALENPSIRVRVLEAASSLAIDVAAAHVSAELGAAAGFSHAVYPDHVTRLQPQLQLRSPASMDRLADPAFGAGDLVLVSGGASGITAECALALAARYQVRLALLGSTALADAPLKRPDLLANLRRFDAAGITYRYFACDLGDPAQVNATVADIERQLGPVRALVHAAGTNHARRIELIPDHDFLAVLTPKIAGLQHLLAALDLTRLHTLIAFSSVIAKSGMAGNADYAYANEWLNGALACLGEQRRQLRCLSFNFSVWGDVGMGVDSVAHLQGLGIEPIPLEQGVSQVLALLERQWPAPDLVVCSRMGALPTLDFVQSALPAGRFLQDVLLRQSGVELVTQAELHPDLDLYLSDHNYKGSLLFPAVLGLEAMVQVACACAGLTAGPGVALSDVVFHQPVVVPQEGRAIRIYARVLAEPSGQPGDLGVVRVAVSIRSAASGFASDHFTAICSIGADSLPEQTREIPWPGPLAVDPAEWLYGSLFFQGPMFQNIVSVHELSPQSILARIRCTGMAPVFAASAGFETCFGLPQLRDCYLHAVQASVPHLRILPVGIERIVSRSSHAAFRYVHARLRECVGKEYCFDIDVMDGDGDLIEQITGLRCRALEPYVNPAVIDKVQRLFDASALHSTAALARSQAQCRTNAEDA